MNSMQDIVEAVMPLAVLQAMTPEAIESIPPCLLHGQNLIAIYKFPFRVGRESRVQKVNGKLERFERPHTSDKIPNNDLYLLDRGSLLNVSREHIKLEKHNGVYMMIDRGSACGTRLIDGKTSKSEEGDSFMLKDGDIIAMGTEGTPFLFKFISLDEVRVKVFS